MEIEICGPSLRYIYKKGRKIMAKNICIGLGNTGNNIIQLIASNNTLSDTILYAVDSVASSIKMENVDRVKYLPILSDDKSGSGRSRERGAEMFKFHKSNGMFDEMFVECMNAKSPVIVITSAAGGTGSGATVPLCAELVKNGIQVIPIIVAPNKNDPDAFHLNTKDLFFELGEINVETYAVFENRKGDANYDPINREIVDMIEIIFGKKYDPTDRDSIDDSDLDVVMTVPGRFVAVSATAASIPELARDITRKIFSGFQPAWTKEEADKYTMVTACSLKSMFADKDFKQVFADVNDRILHSYDEYRHVVVDDNDGICSASIIVAGLPRPSIVDIDNDYNAATSLGEGITKSRRPSFLNNKKASITEIDKNDGTKERHFSWTAKK